MTPLSSVDRDRLGRRWAIDTNIIGSRTCAVTRLIALWEEGWIGLGRSDVLESELERAALGQRYTLRAQIPSLLFESLGPWTLGHTRTNRMIAGNDQDAQRLDDVFRLLFPNRDRETARANDVRDALHVANALRYAMDGFITFDKGILRARDRFKDAYRGFDLLTPRQAVTIAHRLLRRHQQRPS